MNKIYRTKSIHACSRISWTTDGIATCLIPRDYLKPILTTELCISAKKAIKKVVHIHLIISISFPHGAQRFFKTCSIKAFNVIHFRKANWITTHCVCDAKLIKSPFLKLPFVMDFIFIDVFQSNNVYCNRTIRNECLWKAMEKLLRSWNARDQVQLIYIQDRYLFFLLKRCSTTTFCVL